MNICFEARFYTDGDFSFRKDRLNMLFEKESSLYKGTTIKYSFDDDSDDYFIYISLDVDGEDSYRCRYVLRDLLESLICSISVSKYWLVKSLYELLNYFLEDVWKDLNQEKYKELSGNYDGTWVYLKMEE